MNFDPRNSLVLCSPRGPSNGMLREKVEGDPTDRRLANESPLERGSRRAYLYQRLLRPLTNICVPRQTPGCHLHRWGDYLRSMSFLRRRLPR